MDSPDIVVQSASPPERSLSRILKSRRRKQPQSPHSPQSPRSSQSQLPDNASGVSVDSNTLSVDRGAGFLRSSLDRGVGKLGGNRSHSATSSDGGETRGSFDSTASGHKLSRLLKSTSRRRRKKERANEELDTVLTHANTIAADGSNPYQSNIDNGSTESIGKTKSIASSLLTDDSDPEPIVRPPLASRNSHTGLLTFSSPLIAAETVPISKPLFEDPFGAEADNQGPREQLRNGLETIQNQPGDVPGLGINTALASNNTSVKDPILPTQDSKSQTLSGPLSSLGTLFNTSKKSPVSAPSAPAVLPSSSTTLQTLAISPAPNNDIPSTVVIPATPEQAAAPFATPPRTKTTTISSSLPLTGHRRVRSAVPASTKLSAGSIPPLTPAVEEVSTPGGSLVPASASGGFFSSVFSATQTAGNQFSSFFSPGSAGSRSRSGTAPSQTERTGPVGGEEVIFPASRDGRVVPDLPPKEPAVATLGSGSLSLSHLGISEPSPAVSMTSQEEYTEELTGSPDGLPVDGSVSPTKMEQTAAAEAVAAAYSEKRPRASSGYLDQLNQGARPPSRGSGTAADVTPPLSLTNGKEGSIIRGTGSVRSKISEKRRRNRGNSNVTGGAIAAALAASHGVIANPAALKARLTSLPLANAKRNKDFHTLFKSVPDDDYLIEDYSAALQREILLHGRLYISERHICFSSNIMGYVTTLVINFDEVMSLEKKNTAVIFPNAVVIQTLHAKNIFASLISREATYDLLLNIWKVKHPNIKPTEVGHTLDNTVAAAKNDAAGSEDGSDDVSEEASEDDDDDDEAGSYLEAEGASAAGSDVGDRAGTVRAVSAATVAPTTNGGLSKVPTTDGATGESSNDFTGPATHSPTDCTDSDTHYEKLVLDDTVPAPLGKVYSMMFGPLSGNYMRKFLESQESGDIQYEDDKKGMDEATKSFSYSYIKKLTGSLGPKQTKCLVAQTLDFFDLENSVSVTCSTQTPDVPGGNIFVTKTRYCLMWGPANSTRILMSSGVEWSGKSWLRVAIEKGAEGGQAAHGKDLAAFLRSHVSAKSPVKSSRSGKKGKKKRSIGSPDSGALARKRASADATAKKKSDWGPLEPMHEIFGAVVDVVQPMVSPTAVLSVLLFFVTILWIRSSYRQPTRSTAERASVTTPQRLAAFEEMWRREENDLWDWLDDRLQLDDLYRSKPAQGASSAQQVMHGKAMQETIKGEKMSQRQVDEAIRVTEEKLEALKMVVEKGRE